MNFSAQKILEKSCDKNDFAVFHDPATATIRDRGFCVDKRE